MTVGGRLRTPVALVLGLAAVYLLGAAAVWFTPQDGSIAYWWPAAGVSVVMVALAPRSWWPAVAVALAAVSMLANISGGRAWEVAAAFGIANAAEAVVAGLLLKDERGRLIELDRMHHFVRLVVAALVGAAVIAVLAALTVVVADGGPFLATLRSVFTSHAAATLVIVPVAMTWRLRNAAGERWEYPVQITLLTVVTLVAFVPEHSLPVAAIGMPFLVWAALRLDARTVSLELLANAVVTILLTAAGRGPYGGTGAEAAFSLQVGASLVLGYILTIALVALPLTLAVTQRARVLEELAGSERLFRRNFTESLTGMLLLAQRGNRLEIIDANNTARALLDEPGHSVVGRYFDRVLKQPGELRGATQTMLEGELDGWRGRVQLAHRPGSQVEISISQISTQPEPTFAAQLLDVSALHQSMARAQDAEQLATTLLDTARCIMMLTDLDGTVLRVNQATTVLTGFTEEQVVGQPFWATVVVEHRADAVRQMFAERSALAPHRETDVRTIGGEQLRVVWSTEVIRDEDGRPRYGVLTGVDVTAERASAGLTANLFQAGISTAIIGLDSQGRIKLVNPGAASLLGATTEELRGRAFTDLLDPAELAERGHGETGWRALTASLEGSTESIARDWTWLSVQGRRRTVEMTLSGGGSQFGPQAGFLVLARDVTEQRHGQMMLMAALEKERMASDRLRQLDAAKNEFVSTVSHELRTPVTSIVGYTEMLADGSPVPPHDQQRPLLDTIARNGARLISLCNDLLALAGLDTGGTVWDRGVVDLRQVTRHTEDSMRPLLRDRDLTLEVELSDAPVPVLGDAVQLERVVLNLLSNAVKFTPDGGRVSARAWSDGDEAWLVVSDTGIGIPEQEQDSLFQKFFRASSAQAMAIQGTGLGLSIVAGIVAAHGGRISVESTPGLGSTFSVKLPLHRD
jgi:PAS domain S-box-containing protein